MKNLKIFGDSIIKGVTYNGQSYHLCQEHDFDTLRAQGVTVENNAKMGATIDAGLKQLDRKLGSCDGDTTVLFCFGGNDCDYDWKAISEDPDGEHLPHTPSETHLHIYSLAPSFESSEESAVKELSISRKTAEISNSCSPMAALFRLMAMRERCFSR